MRRMIPAVLVAAVLAGCGGSDSKPAESKDFTTAGERAVAKALADDSGGTFRSASVSCTPGEGDNMTCTVNATKGSDPTTVPVIYPKVRCTDEATCFVDSTAATVDGQRAFTP